MRLSALIILFLAGCTQFHVHQTDGDPNNPQAQRTTDLRASAWFSSAQHLEKLRASQTDRTQAFGMGAANQQGDTNMVAALEAIAKILEALRPAP